MNTFYSLSLSIKYLFFFIFFSFSNILEAQETSKLVIKPTLAFQLWSTYTDDQQLYDASTQQFEAVDNRLNFQLHRSRVGLKGSYDTRWVYDLTAAFDFVGQDVLAGTVGGRNNGASPAIRLWNALVQYQLIPKSEWLYITFGYQLARYSRESITGPFVTGSFEKPWSQNYIRRHSVGIGPGRASGVNVGGLMNTSSTNLSLNYDVGVFNPLYTDFGGNSSGTRHTLLFTYRAGIHFGDPEQKVYSRGHKFNYKGTRKGITLTVSGAYQGEVDLWDDNSSFGVDILANYGPFNLMGEWMQLKRDLNGDESTADVGHIKLGYYTQLKNGKGLEPVITYVFLSGAMNEPEQTVASELGTFFGKDSYLEFNINYHLTNKITLSISYTNRSGDAGDLNPTLVNNNFFQQGGVGTIQKGDYFGFGLNFAI